MTILMMDGGIIGGFVPKFFSGTKEMLLPVEYAIHNNNNDPVNDFQSVTTSCWRA